ncbi:hypothetical protein B9479_007924 [Cryptococcus floricola]|uniref:Uncharacterized protein n=1 Tax=Cryptococcus floricola TaxID=2591691 RepID=A0A5D3AKI9_9TREE|nr:hypothetical protein B9479_007924 [Cryptococcus floricola]
MPQTHQARKSLNLADIFPPEVFQLILDHVLVLAKSDTSLAVRLMCTCTELLETFSPVAYKQVSLHQGNADKFFYGLAGGRMKKGEVKGWQNDGRRLEKKSVVARRLIWLSMVRRVEIMDTEALVKCSTALEALLKRPLGREGRPYLFFWRPHESNAHEKPVLRLSARAAPPASRFRGRGHLELVQLARSFTIEVDFEEFGDLQCDVAC